MKKITLIAILILLILIFVNPSKLAIFNLADASVSSMKEILMGTSGSDLDEKESGSLGDRLLKDNDGEAWLGGYGKIAKKYLVTEGQQYKL